MVFFCIYWMMNKKKCEDLYLKIKRKMFCLWMVCMHYYSSSWAEFAVSPSAYIFVCRIHYVCVLPALNSIIWVHYNQLIFIVGKNSDIQVTSVISTHNKLLWINTCKLMCSSHKCGFLSVSLSFLALSLEIISVIIWSSSWTVGKI